MRVLVVEDHRRLAEAVAGGLRDEGMAVDVAFDGQDALDHVALARYDVIILDRDLPSVHGDQVCQELAERRCPGRVLMLTAAATIADRVEGLGLGADDYLPKPFDFAELVARIRALARRAVVPLRPILTCGDLSVDPAKRLAVRAGRRRTEPGPGTEAGPAVTTATQTTRCGMAAARAWDRLHPRLARRGAREHHDGELPVIEGTLIRLAVDHLPGDRHPKPLWLWLWFSRTGASEADADRCWQASLTPMGAPASCLIDSRRGRG